MVGIDFLSVLSCLPARPINNVSGAEVPIKV